MALGALATAATFVLVLINQKGTQKQIDSLSQMAEMFSRHYQLERIQAGSNIYIIRKSKFPPNPERSVQFSGKRTKRSVQKIGCTQHL